MSSDQTPFERAVDAEARSGLSTPDDTDDTDEDTARPVEVIEAGHGDLTAMSTTIGGDSVDLAEPRTEPQFHDVAEYMSGEYGRPRPRRFWHARQIGRTPQMQLIKNTVAQQLTGGDPVVTGEEEVDGALRELADLVEDIYDGPHFHRKGWDDLITDTVNDFIDFGWGYWEQRPSADGSLPIAAFKPLPALSVQHNLDDDSGEFASEVDDENPMLYFVPYRTRGGNVSAARGDPHGLLEEEVVVMRGPLTSENNTAYGQSPATKVREWIELITDVDAPQKRHYADSQLPAGLVHFEGAIGKDDLQEFEQNILEVAGDPQEMVTTTADGPATWIPIGGEVADLDAIAQQEHYYKLVLAAIGLNQSEINVVESSGFAKESPELQKMVYKNVTKPFMKTITNAQNNQALPRIFDALDADLDTPLEFDMERFDPVQEAQERQEAREEYGMGALSLGEYRGELGKETESYVVELAGQEVDLATTPRDVVETLRRIESGEVDDEEADATGGDEGN